MIHTLLLALALTAPLHARTKTPPRPAPKPQPPPPAPDEDESPVFDPPEPDEPDEPADETPQPKKRGNPFDPSKPDFTEEEYGAIGLGFLCTCFCFVAGVIALIVFIVRRGNKPSSPAQPYAAATAPPAAAPMTVPFHLSVFAVGMRANARQTVAQQLILAGAQADPTTVTERTQLVRELAKAVRGLEPEWTHFGYGERLDLADESAAQRSYQLAVDDFSKRSADTSLSGESTYAVMTLVLCTRRQLKGVSALDDRAQIRALLDDRGALSEHDLMGAFIAWSQPLSGYEVLTRFPEMHAVK